MNCGRDAVMAAAPASTFIATQAPDPLQSVECRNESWTLLLHISGSLLQSSTRQPHVPCKRPLPAGSASNRLLYARAHGLWCRVPAEYWLWRCPQGDVPFHFVPLRRPTDCKTAYLPSHSPGARTSSSRSTTLKAHTHCQPVQDAFWKGAAC